MLAASFIFFFFNATATTEIYTLSLHDALPISDIGAPPRPFGPAGSRPRRAAWLAARSEEHTSELQSHSDLVCRLLLEKKKQNTEPVRNFHHDTHRSGRLDTVLHITYN